MDAKLERLLIRSGISQYDRWTWFRDASFTGHVIIVPDENVRNAIYRCWLPQIRLVLAEVALTVGSVARDPPSVIKKAAYRGLKAEPTNQRLPD